jgi:cytochrome P450
MKDPHIFDAAPFIVDTVGELGRPRAPLPANRDLDHLPGESGLVAGVLNAIGWIRRGNRHLLEQVARYGSLYRTQFAHIPIVCVAEPELINQISRNEDRAWSAALAWRAFFEGIDDRVSSPDSLTTLDFEPHKDARRLLQPAFSGRAMESYLQLAIPKFERAVDRWLVRGRVVIKPEVRRLFAAVAGHILIGAEDDAEAELLDRALADYWGAPLALVQNALLSPRWRRAKAGYHKLFSTFRARVASRKASGGNDLFSRLCSNSGEIAWLDDDGLVRIFISVLAGAFDTTSFGLASTIYLLARDVDWQMRVREECLATASAGVTYEQLRGLPQLEWVWKETLRLFPVAPDMPRRALRDVELGGYRIPAGAFVFAMIAPVMQDARFWDHPHRFDPERFSPERAEDKRQRGAYLPFGAGAHACIGAQLATLEAKAFLSVLLTRCRFRLERPYVGHHVLNPLGNVTGDVALVLEPISGGHS